LKNGLLLFGEEMCLIYTVGFDHVQAFGIYVAAADFYVFHLQDPRGMEYGAVFHEELRGFEFAVHPGGAAEFDVVFCRDIPNDRAFAFDGPGLDFGLNHTSMANQQ